MSRGAAAGQGGEITVSASPEAAPRANAATHRATDARSQLRRVVFLGMGHLVTNSLAVNGDEFEARFHHEDWPDNTGTHDIRGRVVAWAGNLPAELRLTSSALPRPLTAVVLRYQYDSKDEKRWFPSEILGWYETVGGVGMPALSRKVLEIEFGLPDSAEGFVPRDFLPQRAAVPPLTLVASNSVVYWLNGGSLEPVAVASPPLRAARSLFLWVCGLALALSMAAVLWRRLCQRNSSWLTHGWLVHAVSVACHLMSASGLGAQEADAPLTPEHRFFLEFLTNRPPVKRIELELSGNRFETRTADGTLVDRGTPAFVPAQGALQSDGYFFWQFPTRHPNTMSCIYGANADHFWTVDDGSVAVSPRHGPGAHQGNGPEFLVRYYRRMLDNVLMFGVEDVVHDSLVWLSPLEFRAKARNDSQTLLQGQLFLDQSGRPFRLSYRDEAANSVDAEVAYSYGISGEPHPSEIVITRRLATGSLRMLTNRIRKLETGVLSDLESAFHPRAFLEVDFKRSLLIFSNAMRFRATPAGLVRDEGDVEIVEAFASKENKESSRLNRWLAAGSCLAVMVAFLLVWKPGRRWKHGAEQKEQRSRI